MSSGHPTSGPRHLAGGASRRPARPDPRPAPKPPAHRGAGGRHLARRGAAPASARPAAQVPTGAPDADEVAPLARVKRSRIAFALSATVAALPVLVLDNLPATAAQDDEVRTVAADDTSSSTTEAPATSTTEDPTTTTIVVEVADTAGEPEETTTSEAEETTTTGAEDREPEPVAALAAPAPEPAPTTETTQAPPSTPPSEGYAYGDPDDPATWDRLAQCESGGNWSLNSGNGYYGGLQFSLATWQDVGGSGYPHESSREEQIHRGQILQARYGWGQWPHCSSKLGYR
ncbi:MAG: transglycosylase family protein [Acidimicrobiia bacterium]